MTFEEELIATYSVVFEEGYDEGDACFGCSGWSISECDECGEEFNCYDSEFNHIYLDIVCHPSKKHYCLVCYIKKHCLDKERVREVLGKHTSHEERDCCCLANIWKELGL